MPEKFECVRSHSRVYLPQDLVIEIILRLPAKSVGRFRCVSTVWLSISTDPSFILTHTRRISKYLVFHFIPRNLLSRKAVETFPPPENELFTVCIGKRKFDDIAHVPVSSCDGLVCFREKIFGCPTFNYDAGFPSRGASIKYVLNPLTGLRIDIPSHSVDRFGNTSSACQLYYHRWTGQYRLLNAHGSTFGKPLYAEVLTLGGAMNSWRRINATADPDVWVLWEKSVLVNDCLYWICKKLPQGNTILVFDISEEAFSYMELPPNVVSCMANIGLLDIEGKLCCWMVSSDENLIDSYLINIWVAVGGGEKWRNTYSLFLADEWRRPIYPSPCYTLIMFVFFSRGGILFLVCGSGIPYLLSWDLISGNHYIVRLSNQSDMKFDPTLIHSETLIDMATIMQYA